MTAQYLPAPDWVEAQEIQTLSIPHSREAEEACIGAVLINSEAYWDLSAFLKSSDFYIQRNGFIWTAFDNLFKKHTPIDLLTVSQELERMEYLAEIGGPAYLTSLINQVPSSLNAESYGRIVEGHSVRRGMILAANKIAATAYNVTMDIEAAYSQGKKAYDSAYRESGEFKTIKELIAIEYDRIDARANGEDETVIPTGFIDLDKLLDGGLRGGNLVLVAGRPGMGKTGLMLDIAKHVALDLHKRVAIFSLEMSNEQVTLRLVVKEGIAMKSIRTGKMEESEWPIFTHAVEKYGDSQIFMSDLPAINPVQIRAKAHQLVNQYGVDLIIVDYLQLMGSDNNIENRNQEVSYISRSLKILARELNIPIIAGAQLSRKVEERQDKHPILSDLRDSGSLEQDADIVLFLYRDEVYDKNTEKGHIAELILAKQRDGETGTVDLIFRGSLMKFENASTRVFKPNSYDDTRRADIHGDD